MGCGKNIFASFSGVLSEEEGGESKSREPLEPASFRKEGRRKDGDQEEKTILPPTKDYHPLPAPLPFYAYDDVRA